MRKPWKEAQKALTAPSTSFLIHMLVGVTTDWATPCFITSPGKQRLRLLFDAICFIHRVKRSSAVAIPFCIEGQTMLLLLQQRTHNETAMETASA
jgi:hypothetical protein